MKYHISKGFIVQKFEDKTVIFNSGVTVLYTLNNSASEIFRMLEKRLEEKKIIDIMTKKYKVGSEEITKDLAKLVNDLLEKKIIVRGKNI